MKNLWKFVSFKVFAVSPFMFLSEVTNAQQYAVPPSYAGVAVQGQMGTGEVAANEMAGMAYASSPSGQSCNNGIYDNTRLQANGMLMNPGPGGHR